MHFTLFEEKRKVFLIKIFFIFDQLTIIAPGFNLYINIAKII